MWVLVIITDVALYSLQALLHLALTDTLWARHSRNWCLYFVGRSKGSEEATSSAQSDTADKCQKWDLNLHLSILGPSGAFSHTLLSHSVSGA